MSKSIKCFQHIMKVEEIKGQRILTSFVPPDDQNRVELYTRNLPQHLDEDTIVPFFETIGPIHCLRLMMDKLNVGNRGFAYVTYLNSDDAYMAIRSLNGKEILPGCQVTVAQSMNNCRIFVGGIPIKRTKDEVWQEFSKRGITNIVDVIMYRSYNNRAENRGFVFVEFPTHQYAAKMRNKMRGLCLWGNEVIVDWSVPEPVVSDEDMMKVKIIYLRNLNVMESREYLRELIGNYMRPEYVQKVYKFKNYAFIHLVSREKALELMFALKEHYKNTNVEVTFAKPRSEYTKPEYRKKMLSRTPTSSISESDSLRDLHNIDFTSRFSALALDNRRSRTSQQERPNPFLLKTDTLEHPQRVMEETARTRCNLDDFRYLWPSYPCSWDTHSSGNKSSDYSSSVQRRDNFFRD